METSKYEVRKARSVQVLSAGVEPVKDGFNEYFVPDQSQEGLKYKVMISKGWYACGLPRDIIRAPKNFDIGKRAATINFLQ